MEEQFVRIAAYVLAYCERGRHSLSRFLLTRDEWNDATSVCLWVMFRFLPDAALVCLKNHPSRLSAVNLCIQGTHDPVDTYTAWLQQHWTGHSLPLNSAQKKFISFVIRDVALEARTVNAITTDEGDRTFEDMSSSTTLLLLLENDLEEEAKIFLDRYGPLMRTTSGLSMLNRGSIEEPGFRNNTAVQIAEEKGYADVLDLLIDLGAEADADQSVSPEDSDMDEDIFDIEGSGDDLVSEGDLVSDVDEGGVE